MTVIKAGAKLCMGQGLLDMSLSLLLRVERENCMIKESQNLIKNDPIFISVYIYRPQSGVEHN